jgi:hypothetical protein
MKESAHRRVAVFSEGIHHGGTKSGLRAKGQPTFYIRLARED